MTLTEHLAELRMRIIRAGLAVLVGAIVVVAFYDTILGWMLRALRQPVRPQAGGLLRSLDRPDNR